MLAIIELISLFRWEANNYLGSGSGTSVQLMPVQLGTAGHRERRLA